jgi:hypothetical protein
MRHGGEYDLARRSSGGPLDNVIGEALHTRSG